MLHAAYSTTCAPVTGADRHVPAPPVAPTRDPPPAAPPPGDSPRPGGRGVGPAGVRPSGLRACGRRACTVRARARRCGAAGAVLPWCGGADRVRRGRRRPGR
ncbi:hypothetical protein CXF45_03540 [Corynebacterium bovis]|nr:hypothetical protein CXF45_03540 [Corynebacterium bovis]